MCYYGNRFAYSPVSNDSEEEEEEQGANKNFGYSILFNISYIICFLETVKMRSVSSKSDSLKQPLTSMEAVSFIFIRTRLYGVYT